MSNLDFSPNVALEQLIDQRAKELLQKITPVLKAQSDEIVSLTKDIDYLMDSITLTRNQVKSIKEAVALTVRQECVSQADFKERSGKIRWQLYDDLKKHFDVLSYQDIPRKQFYTTIDLIKTWHYKKRH